MVIDRPLLRKIIKNHLVIIKKLQKELESQEKFEKSIDLRALQNEDVMNSE